MIANNPLKSSRLLLLSTLRRLNVKVEKKCVGKQAKYYSINFMGKDIAFEQEIMIYF